MIQVKKLIDLIELEVDELLDEPKQDIHYLNYAIDTLSLYLNQQNDPSLLYSQLVTSGTTIEGTPVPRFGYPIEISNNVVTITDEDISSIELKLQRPRPRIVITPPTPPVYETRLLEEEDFTNPDIYIELPDAYVTPLVLLAAYLIKKKTYIPGEYTQLDLQFVSTLKDAITAARGY
jgi:hypothetical protein